MKLSELLEVGKPVTVQYTDELGEVLITAYWKELIDGFGWGLVDINNKPLHATEDTLIDSNWSTQINASQFAIEKFKQSIRTMLPSHRQLIKLGLVQVSKSLRDCFNGDGDHDDPLREQERICDQLIETIDSI